MLEQDYIIVNIKKLTIDVISDMQNTFNCLSVWELRAQLRTKLPYYRVFLRPVFRQTLSRVVGVESFRNNAEDDEEYGFLSQTVTLHRYLDFFKRMDKPSVEDYVYTVAADCKSLLNIIAHWLISRCIPVILHDC